MAADLAGARPYAAPFAACLAGLLLTVLAFGDLPLLGGAFGASMSGALAALLARDPRVAAAAGLASGAVVAAFLGIVTLVGPVLVLGLPVANAPGPVLVVQAALLGLLPGGVAALLARLLGPVREPGTPGPAGGEPPRPPSP